MFSWIEVNERSGSRNDEYLKNKSVPDVNGDR